MRSACGYDKTNERQSSISSSPFRFSLNFSSFRPTMAPAAQVINGPEKEKKFKTVNCNPCLSEQKTSLRGVVADLMSCANPDKPIVSLGVGDLSGHPSFKKSHDFSQFVAEAVNSGDFDGYPPSCGYLYSRRAVAEYLASGVATAGDKSMMDPNDVFLTCGGTQALQVCLAALATRGCNVLLPRPGFPPYEAACAIYGIEPRYYDLLAVKGWEVDLAQVKALVDDRTAAIVVINPNNPCGAVYSRRHLLQIAEVVRSLNVPIIADELYGHMVFGEAEFVPMAALAATVPVITIGALSKRWLVPGWRLGWIAVSDPTGALRQVKTAIERLMNVSLGPCSIIQAALPSILSSSNEDFHERVLNELESSCDLLYKKMNQVGAFKLHSKPKGAMFSMIEIRKEFLGVFEDDMDFARRLMREESILVLPGSVLGLKNWIRMFFGVPQTKLADACDRIKTFCERHQNR